MRKNVIRIGIWLILACFTNVNAQVQLSGYTKDATTGEILIGTSIMWIDSLGNVHGTASNSYGFYSLQVPKGKSLILSTMIGYSIKTDSLELFKDHAYTIKLIQTSKYLNSVIIPGKKIYEPHSFSFDGNNIEMKIPSQTILQLPRLMGEADVMKSIQFLPGVKQGSEGDAGLYVRGGSPDQNLILMDGVPIYNIYHLFGFISVFNPQSINDITLYKGGFSGKYEGRLSSVVDIRLKEGDYYKHRKEFSISPLAGTVLLDGPIKKGKSSYLFTARRTWIDALIGLTQLGDDEHIGYNFHDINGKMNFDLGNQQQLFFSIYNSYDKFYNQLKDGSTNTKFGFRWGNSTILTRYTKPLSDKIFLNSDLYFSRYVFNQVDSYETNDNLQKREIQSLIQDLAFKSRVEWSLNLNHSLSGGIELNYRTFHPEIAQYVGANYAYNSGSGFATYFYLLNVFIEDNITIGRFKGMVSSRQSIYIQQNTSHFYVQPHALAGYKFNSTFEAHIGFDHVTQFIHLLTNTTLGQPTDLWVPATSKVPPQTGNQFLVGSEFLFPTSSLSLGIDGYYKEMDGLIEYKEGSSYLYGLNQSWEDKITRGNGNAYGVEILLRRDHHIFSGWISYTWAKSLRQFDEINSGKTFPFKYDRTHDLSIVGSYQINDRSSLTFTFTYRTGNALTLPVGTVESQLPPYWSDLDYEEYRNNLSYQPYIKNRNNFRMPSYHRLDIGYKNTHKLKNDKTQTWSFSVYNVYNRLNPYFIYQSNGKLKQYAFFPILPSIAYTLSF